MVSGVFRPQEGCLAGVDRRAPKFHWDDSAKVATITATDNTLIGVAVQVVGDGADETTGRVWLNASFG